MKKIIGIVSAVLLAGIVFGSLPSARSAAAPIDTELDKLMDRFFRDYIQMDPESAAQLGNLDALGYPYPRDRFMDASDAGQTRIFAFLRKSAETLAAFDLNKASRPQRIAASILKAKLEDMIALEPYRYYVFIPDHLFGLHNRLTDIMTQYHDIAGEKDVRDYLARLALYPERVGQEIEGLDIRAAKGILPPQAVFEVAIKEMTQFISGEPEDNALVTTLGMKLEGLPGLTPERKADFLARAEDLVRTAVVPSYRKFIERLEAVKPKAPAELGVWRIPGGDAFYRQSLRSYTSTDLSPEEIHKMGLQEVERLQAEGSAILKELGFNEDKTFGELYLAYRRKIGQERSEKHYYPAEEASRDKILADYRAHVAAIERELPTVFSLMPKAPVIVEPTPRYKERVEPPSYTPGSIDGRRKGTFFVPPVPPGFKPAMKTLTVHEAIPGHHFQFALARELASYRIFMNLFYFDSFGEGWALYAERLARESGWFADPDTRLGYVYSSLGRALRLVTETALHALRWDQAKLGDYVYSILGNRNWELLRYSAMPGQACAYKVGELKIYELREAARKELGAAFDLKDFHRWVLENGSVPFAFLTAEVERAVREKKSGRSF